MGEVWTFIKNFDLPHRCFPIIYPNGFSLKHLWGHTGKVVPRSWKPLIAMFEKWTENPDKGGEYNSSFVHLSKAFKCLQQDLLLAKLNAYRFDYKSLKFILSFLSKGKYRTKINSSFSEWKHLLIGIPQGSICLSCLIMQHMHLWSFFVYVWI